MTRKKTASIHDVMVAQFDLARTYAEDGAFHSAARILQECAETVKGHAEWADRELETLMSKPKAR